MCHVTFQVLNKLKGIAGSLASSTTSTGRREELRSQVSVSLMWVWVWVTGVGMGV